MKANAKYTFLFTVLAVMSAVPGVGLSAAPIPHVTSGVDRLYVIDCGDAADQTNRVGRREPTSELRSASPATAI
jgi:hypothetical protein